MNITVRSGVFETNSSSSHSICIRMDKDNLCIDRDNIVDNIPINTKVVFVHTNTNRM
jgi:hypothetical protein